MISITDYKMNPQVKAQCPIASYLYELLEVYNNKCTAEKAFVFLNRPLPKSVKPDDEIDCSGLMPELHSVSDLAVKADLSYDETHWRLDAGSYLNEGDVDRGETEDGESMFYWHHVREILTDPLMTINSAADEFGVDRRTLKRHIAGERFFQVNQGGREYHYYLKSTVEQCISRFKK